MVWCSNCARNVGQAYDECGMTCCSACGKVLNEDNFSNDPTFFKNAAGQSQLSGSFVRTIQSDYSVSRERTLNKAYEDMQEILTGLGEEERGSVLNPALAFYTIAVERNFTRGRKKDLVECSCLYVACREKKKPYLLIDFSEHLRVNVYELGAVFLQLCKLLSLEEHPIVQKPLDPSLFIHRYANRLVGDSYMRVAKTALLIIASMKRDWMQTGRKPSGLCGAALYVSALSHGLKYTKSHIVRIVHVCEATLTKRLIEFENTESGSLTIEEFRIKAEEFDKESRSIKQSNNGLKVSGTSELLCEHKGSGKPPIAHGLCDHCYEEFMKLTGGLEGGSEPPAFQRAECVRIAKESAEENASDSIMSCQRQKNSKPLNELDILDAEESDGVQCTETGSLAAAAKHEETNGGAFDKLHGVDGMPRKNCDESESLSDIDDVEVDGYIHNEEEQRYKKIIWEEMNKEYIQEQAAKEAAAEAAKKAYEANFRNCPEDIQAAQELAAAAAAAVAKSRKERQQKRAAEAKNSTPAQTAAEATHQMLTKKRLSSKINYDVLEKLFDESVFAENLKKSRIESHSDNDDVLQSSKKEFQSSDVTEEGKMTAEYEYEDMEDGDGGYNGDFYHENVGEEYEYEDDYGLDDY